MLLWCQDKTFLFIPDVTISRPGAPHVRGRDCPPVEPLEAGHGVIEAAGGYRPLPSTRLPGITIMIVLTTDTGPVAGNYPFESRSARVSESDAMFFMSWSQLSHSISLITLNITHLSELVSDWISCSCYTSLQSAGRSSRLSQFQTKTGFKKSGKF